MIDIKQRRRDRIVEFIEDIYIIAKDRADWWRDRKIQEKVMNIRNLSYFGDELVK